jgi:hypothetical protein
MHISKYCEFLTHAWPKHRKVLTRGKPGVGKTVGARDAAELLGYDFISLSGPLLTPVVVRGYPRPPTEGDGDATHCLFGGIARAFRAVKPTVLFWDDLGATSEETMKAVLELVQFGQIDGRTMPDCVVQAGATNDIGQGAGVQGMIEPLKTRWDTIIEVETDLDDVVNYGLVHGWPTDLLAFLRNTPDALHDWKPSKSITIDGACPRGWEHVAEWINALFDDPEVISGCVGRGRATQYLAFRALINELPDVNQVLLDPEHSPVPDNPSARFLVAMALSAKMSAGNFGQAVKYLNRLPAMFRACAIRDAFRLETSLRRERKLPANYRALATCRDFNAWVVSDDGKEIMSAVD